MVTSRFKLVPKGGWAAFGGSDEVTRLIWASLPTGHSQSSWHYYDFTASTSLWDSDASDDTSRLCASYDCGRMEELDLTLGTSDIPFNQDLADLKQRLIQEYAFEEFTC